MISLSSTYSNENKQEAKKSALENLKRIEKNDFQKLHKPKIIPNDKIKKYEEAFYEVKKLNLYTPRFQSLELPTDSLPSTFRLPGEFEESQAVLISWPSYAFDENGEFVEPFTPGLGILWFQDEQGNWDYEFKNIAGYVLDLEPESPFPPLWAELADAIQYEAKVWMRVAAPEDTTMLKQYMESRNKPLINYEFIIDEDGENAFWARDFGPFGIYYGDKDSLMFVDVEYYPGRPIDDLLSIKIAHQKGYKVHKSKVEMEGGNFMTDGHGNGFYGSVVYLNNSDGSGFAMTEKAPMSISEVDKEISKVFSLNKNIVMTSLRCDGGTGHIDIYSKMANDEEILITKYPEDYNRFQFPDYATVNKNRELISSFNTEYNSKFRFLEVPLPTDDNGTYSRRSCNEFNFDARGFINGLTVNNTFIVPTYSNSINGNKQGDEEALAVIRKHMPGYNVVPIDSRLLTPMGGAIHCITMQIPAENPVLIKHSQYKGSYEIEQIIVNENKIPFKGTARNSSGFASAKMYYKCADSDDWIEKEIELLPDAAGSPSDFKFEFELDFEELACGYLGDINYYMEFNTNNGKTSYKPLTAPNGFYTFNVSDQPVVSVDDNFFGKIEIYPNPANELVYINLPSTKSEVKIEVVDMLGNTIAIYGVNNGDNLAVINVSSFQPGFYICRIQHGTNIEMRKIVVTR